MILENGGEFPFLKGSIFRSLISVSLLTRDQFVSKGDKASDNYLSLMAIVRVLLVVIQKTLLFFCCILDNNFSLNIGRVFKTKKIVVKKSCFP